MSLAPKISACLQMLSKLSPEGQLELVRQLRQRSNLLAKERKLYSYYPDDGPLRRALYPRHMEFFAAGGHHERLPSCPPDCDGSPHRDRLMLAANRVGKTESVGGYEVALHATGRYPDWWPGLRFRRPVEIWAAGKRNESTRDVVQKVLFGRVAWHGRQKTVSGTELIPREDIGAITWKRGVPDLIDTGKVRHRSGGWSDIGIKSYEQGRGSFEGTARDIVWFDEEPPIDVYVEAGMRTMTTHGHVLLTFTPLEGMSTVVLEFIPGGSLPPRDEELVGNVLRAVGYGG